MVRPILDYGCTVWGLYTQGNIDKLEMVQCRAARFIMNSYFHLASVAEMLNELNLPSLSSRRDKMKLITCKSLLTIISQYQIMT